MKRNPALLLAYLLAIVLGTLLFVSGADAIPDHQSPSIGATEWTSDYPAGKQTVISERNTSSDGNPVRQGNLPYGSNARRHDLAGEDPVDVGTGGTLCIDPFDIQQCLSVRLGRRIGTRNEILGEVDGIRVDYRLSDGLRLNGIAGYPVLSAEDKFNFTRQVFGISAATNRFAQAWDLNGFLLQQQENGDTVGKSMGGGIRYLQPGRSLLVYLDYDVADNLLGVSTATGAWRLPFKTTISTTLDHRNRPIPGQQQRYLQQSMTALEGWNLILPADRLALYTRDGRGEVNTLAVGLSHALSRRVQLSGDVAMLESRNDANADTLITVSSREYIYHSKLTGKGLMLPGDRSNLDLRHNVTQTGRISTAALDTKYAINRFWNIMPKLRSDYHSAVLEGAPHWVTSPMVKIEYRQNKQSGFQIEAGGKRTTGIKSAADDSRASYFVSLGYQAKF